MRSNPPLKELTFLQLQNPNFQVIKAKSPGVKFKISPTHSCSSIPLINKSMKLGLISEIMSINRLINSPIQTKSILNKQIPFKIKEKKSNSSLSKDITTLNYIKEATKIEKNENEQNNISEMSKKVFKFAEINPIYSDCIDDLDKKCLFFNSKIQKKFKKKLDRQIYENLPYCNKQLKLKPKSLKPLKNKNLQKIKQLISKEKAKVISELSYDHNQAKNLNYFDMVFIKKNLNSNKSIDKFSTILMIHLNPNTCIQDDWNFFNKISESCVLILIIPENCNYCEQILFFDGVFKENFSNLSRCPLIIDYREIITLLPSLKESEIKHLIIISEIFANTSFLSTKKDLQKNIGNFNFDCIFPKEMKNFKIAIDLIYFQREIIFTNSVLEMIGCLLQGNKIPLEMMNESIIQLNIKQTLKLIKAKKKKEKYIVQWRNLFKLLQKNTKIAEMKDSYLFQEFAFFRKNISKTRNNLLKKNSSVPYEAYKTVCHDLIKRNLPYFVKENTNSYPQSYENEVILKKLCNISESFQLKINKYNKKNPIFKELNAYLIQN